MAVLEWDQLGEKIYENGVDRGVLYIPDEDGDYSDGVPWNGLVSVTESPTGAEANTQYADNIKYAVLYSAEEFGATLEAFTYPEEFNQFDGLSTPAPGVYVGQQGRKGFGLCYRTKIGNDLDEDAGYKLHLIYGCRAAPSEKAYTTVNDSPEALTFSWELSSLPVSVTGMKPTSILVIDSTKVDAGDLEDLEEMLYGTVGTDPQLPTPDVVLGLFTGSQVEATPTEPAFNSGTNTITIPTVTGVTYRINGDPVGAGPVVITENTVVTATPNAGYVFPEVTDDDWFYEYTAP